MNKKWSLKFPTKEDAGKWFFVKQDFRDGNPPIIKFKKLRLGKDEELYLCPESDYGMAVDTIGINLSSYRPQFTQFMGPIWTPLSEGD